jgi:hypothetical protein
MASDKLNIIDYLSSIIEQTIKQVYMHPVTFELVWLDEIEIDESYMEDMGRKLSKIEKNFLKNITWSTLITNKNMTKATGRSNRNGNDDPRGGGCGGFRIPVEEFKYTIKNENGITIKDITEITYRLKGSKYDCWYELFSNLKITKQSNTFMSFLIQFGYGS